jgi:hypothetical protein
MVIFAQRGLGAAHLTEDDSIGAETQSGPKQLSDGHLAITLRVRGSRLETNNVSRKVELSSVFDRYEPLVVRNLPSQHVEEGCLASSGPTRNDDRPAFRDRRLEKLR